MFMFFNLIVFLFGIILLIMIGIWDRFFCCSFLMIFWINGMCDLDRIDSLMICVLLCLVVLMILLGVRWIFL